MPNSDSTETSHQEMMVRLVHDVAAAAFDVIIHTWLL